MTHDRWMRNPSPDEELRRLEREADPRDRASVLAWLDARDEAGFDLEAALRRLLDSVNCRAVRPGDYPKWHVDRRESGGHVRHWPVPFDSGGPGGHDPDDLAGLVRVVVESGDGWYNPWRRMSGRIDSRDRPTGDASTFAFAVLEGERDERAILTVGIARVPAHVTDPWNVWPAELDPWEWETFGGGVKPEWMRHVNAANRTGAMRRTREQVFRWARTPGPDRVVADASDARRLVRRLGR